MLALPLVFASLIALPLFFSGGVLAHGPPPGGCAMYHDLEYQSELTSLVVDNGEQQYDVIANPRVTVPVTRDQQFQIEYTLHTDDLGFRMENGSRVEANSSGEEGYAWYRDFANGYPFSKCAGPVEGDSDFEISEEYPVSHMFQGEGPHLVFFETTLDDSRPKAEFYLQIVEDLSEPETETEDQDSETADEQPEEDQADAEESVLEPFISQSDGTETASTDSELAGGSLTINGTIASLAYPANVSEGADAPLILAGDWSLTVNSTAVSDFQANITVVAADGSDRESYIITNFTAVNASAVQFDNNLASVASSAAIVSDESEESVNMVVTIERLNAVRIDLDQSLGGNETSPIYGIVDSLVISEDGQETRVITR